MRIEIVGVACPDLPGVSVGLQEGAAVVDAHPAAGDDLRWEFDVAVRSPLAGTEVGTDDLRGPFVHGKPGGRFLYLSWQQAGGMFRRAKLMLDAVPPDVLSAAAVGEGLRGTVRLVMPDGTPLCAAVRPPTISWSRA